jgi:DNA replication protein DnaC
LRADHAVALLGEPGFGKTRLLAALTRQARRADLPVISAAQLKPGISGRVALTRLLAHPQQA